MKKVILILPLIIILSLKAGAISEKDIFDYSKGDILLENLPEGLDISSAEELLNSGKSDEIEADLFNKITSDIKSIFGENIKFFSGMTAIFLIGTITGNINASFGSEDYKKYFSFLYLGIISLYSFSYISSSAELAIKSIDTANNMMLSSLPVLTLIWSIGGNAVQAAKEGAFLIFSIELLEDIISKYLIIITRILFIFSILASLGDNTMIKISAFIKKITKIIIVFLFTCLSTILYFSGAVAAAKDSIILRGTRFAAGNFIPIVGNLVGESSKTLFSLFGIIKAKCGILLIFILLFTVITPIISLFIKKIFLIFTSSVAGMLSESGGESLISGITGIFDILIALTVSSAVYFLIFIGLFVKTGAVIS